MKIIYFITILVCKLLHCATMSDLYVQNENVDKQHEQKKSISFEINKFEECETESKDKLTQVFIVQHGE